MSENMFKIDILPKNISLKVVENYLRNHFHIQEEILFVQRKRNSTKKIYEHIEKDASSNFYFLGLTNAGKSSLLNLLLEELVENSKPITVSEIPNTTLDFIQISLPNKKKIQDSVGFTYDYCFKDFEMLQKILVKKEIRPKNFYLKNITVLKMYGKEFNNIYETIVVIKECKKSFIVDFAFYAGNDIIKSEYVKIKKSTIDELSYSLLFFAEFKLNQKLKSFITLSTNRDFWRW